MLDSLNSTLSLLKAIPASAIRKVLNPVNKAVTRFRRRRLQRNLPPVDMVSNRVVAVVGGQIDKVIPFRDLGNSHMRIAVLGRETTRSISYRLNLLEEFGEGIRSLWDSGRAMWLSNQSQLEVDDLNDDGLHEVYFSTSLFGSGSGTVELFCLIPEERRLGSVCWQYDWQSWNSPPTPRLVAGPNTDAATLYLLEKMATRLGFTKTRQIDLESPVFAVMRWHRDNSNLTNGLVQTHRYAGTPACQSTVLAQCDAGTLTFVAHFKGPVLCIDHETHQHYVVWAPGWIYHWPTVLSFVAPYLYIGTRGQGLLRYNISNNLIVQVKEFDGRDLSEVGSITSRLEHAVVNNLSVPVAELNRREQNASPLGSRILS